MWLQALPPYNYYKKKKKMNSVLVREGQGDKWKNTGLFLLGIFCGKKKNFKTSSPFFFFYFLWNCVSKSTLVNMFFIEIKSMWISFTYRSVLQQLLFRWPLSCAAFSSPRGVEKKQRFQDNAENYTFLNMTEEKCDSFEIRTIILGIFGFFNQKWSAVWWRHLLAYSFWNPFFVEFFRSGH